MTRGPEKRAQIGIDWRVANRLAPPLFLPTSNKFRLIARPLYSSQKVFILKVMTHAEYDENNWQGACGCHAAPPKKNLPERKGR
jgi:hypothetical protein